MAAESCLYEALSPLSAVAESPADQPSPLPSIDSESYVVFRNEISLSAAQCPSPETIAPDYLSLDFGDDAEGPPVDLIGTPSLDRSPPTERRLEGGWFRSSCRFRSPMLQLHKEILDFCEFLSPTLDEEESRNAAIESVSDVIRYIWPNCKVEVFGSFKTGLYLPTSDIDVVILGSNIKKPQIGLHALSRALHQRGVAKKIQVIGRARVPIIKFVEKRSGISFDISFDVDNGPKAAEFIQDSISKWPPLRPLCLILKVFLQQRQLNEVFTGGIGSYALLAMLIAMLQSLRELKLCREQNLGILLVNFFDMYGRKLNTTEIGVSCNGSGTFFLKSSKGFSKRPGFISIEDPQAPDNDIGKSSFGYFRVKSAFAAAFSTLTNARIILNLGPSRSILSTIIRPDPVLLERKGGSNGEITFNDLLLGADEPLQLEPDNQMDMYCNWQLDDEEESLPRGNLSPVGMISTTSSTKKKRKASKEEKLAKKVRENDNAGMLAKQEASESRRQRKKSKWRKNQGGNSTGFKRCRGTGPLWAHSA